MEVDSIQILTVGGHDYGTGHVRRCLTLAAALRDRQVSAAFLLHGGDQVVRKLVEDRGYPCRDISLERFSDELHRRDPTRTRVLMDSYWIPSAIMSETLRRGFALMVMDDLADKFLQATWVVNCAVGADSGVYDRLTDGVRLLGPEYAMVRPAYSEVARPDAPARARRVLVTIGGSDPLDLAPRVLRLLDSIEGPLDVRVVLGPLARNADACRLQAERSPHLVELHAGLDDLSPLMAWADLAVSGAGQTILELAASGCPALVFQIADNQKFHVSMFSRLGSVEAVADCAEPDDALRLRVKRLIESREARGSMSRAGRQAVDGRGSIRVAEALTRPIPHPEGCRR